MSAWVVPPPGSTGGWGGAAEPRGPDATRTVGSTTSRRNVLFVPKFTKSLWWSAAAKSKVNTQYELSVSAVMASCDEFVVT
jgi:hypothetical protein